MHIQVKLAGAVAGALLLVPSAAAAETFNVQQGVNDAPCTEPIQVQFCPYGTVDGTLTQKTVSESLTYPPPFMLATLTGTYDVTFDGRLSRPDVTVDASITYQGQFDNAQVYQPITAGAPWSAYQSYSNVQMQVRSIDIPAYADSIVTDNGPYNLTIHQTSAAGPVAQLTGTYQRDLSGLADPAITFGKVTGTATVLPESAGAYQGPLSVDFQYTTTETTRLDANGLVTPAVAVTDGIDMGGSKVTHLAAGTAPDDAVNRAQLDAETQARMTADNGLINRIDRVQRKADAGTAVAVAMGGAVFLPDMRFNLTANVATYGRAHAGAVQVGAVVSRHVAFNAGVATGFNRGGQTAGRAGFTVGW